MYVCMRVPVRGWKVMNDPASPPPPRLPSQVTNSTPHPTPNLQHADTKEYFGGCQHAIKEQQGHISCNFDLHPAALTAPLKFKAWISPRGV